MATLLQQLLRRLCLNSEWKYGVFWKLQHRSRLVLTWEDAYYSNHQKHHSLENKCSSEALQGLHDGHFPHDPLGLAVAKMSYHVYSLGEGIVGQVAVTGKHQWISVEDQALDSCYSSESGDGWQAQFLAGVKTIVVVAVVPHGVVLLGSMNKVNEDMQLVIHIRELFSAFQDSLACHVSNHASCSLQNSLPSSDTSTRRHPEVLHGYTKECISSSTIASLRKQDNVSFFGISSAGHMNLEDGLMKDNGLASPQMVQSVDEKLESGELLSDNGLGRNYCKIENTDDKSGLEYKYSLLNILDGERPRSKASLDVPFFIEGQMHKNMVTDLEIKPEFTCQDNLRSFEYNPTGYELHEALGSAFLKENNRWWWELEKTEGGTSSQSQMPEVVESSMLTSESGSDHLLEAVVASFCSKDDSVRSGKSFSTSTDSLLTSGKISEASSTSNTVASPCYSVEFLNSSESYSIRSLNGVSSLSPAACKDQLLRPIESIKATKKRAKPGESCRPRPRDRQLIQDRIKELRELVPNGSKCSIDSLLERTIKHMLFLQSVTKHADKLNNSVKSRACKNEVGVLGYSSYEQGSSWAVEVGGQMKVGPIIVENLTGSGQFLVEMLCEDCDHFLEIAESIRGLGLNILKGITDSHGDKTWMHFIVEGQSNRSINRMDVLWSLVQTLQAKSAV
ncbi:hypothetical protein Dimus_032408 [Dionaea muscipula]